MTRPMRVTNRVPQGRPGMTLRDLATFMADAMRNPNTDQDAPLTVRCSLGGMLLQISADAPLPPRRCPVSVTMAGITTQCRLDHGHRGRHFYPLPEEGDRHV